MHVIVFTGTTGPIYRAILRCLAQWPSTADYDGIPKLLQIVPLRDGLYVTTTSLSLVDYLETRLLSGMSPDPTRLVNPTAEVWGELGARHSPSSLHVRRLS